MVGTATSRNCAVALALTMEHAITAETFATVTVRVSKATRPRAAIIIIHAKWVYSPEREQCVRRCVTQVRQYLEPLVSLGYKIPS